MAKRANLYLGGAGQHAVVSEFLVRGWNVAIPEIDVGDDIFVVRDRDGKLNRIQVKTATAQERNYGYNARFKVPLSQLSQVVEPELTYVFVVGFRRRWDTFLLVERPALYKEYPEHNIGSKADKTLV